uniref:Uncharacterized protein n=1 Tax=Rhizophora mucronata TaxID=61149 RepID=A0A2P2ND28_RHIMU
MSQNYTPHILSINCDFLVCSRFRPKRAWFVHASSPRELELQRGGLLDLFLDHIQ